MRTLAVAHACILALALLTPFTLSPSVDVFFAFRMIQTVLMGQYVLLHHITSTSQSETPGLAKRHSDAEHFLLHIVGRLDSRPPMFQTPSGGVYTLQPYC